MTLRSSPTSTTSSTTTPVLIPVLWTVITPHQAHALLGNTTDLSCVHDDIRVSHSDRLVTVFPRNQHWTLLTCEQDNNYTQAICWDRPDSPNTAAAFNLATDLTAIHNWPPIRFQHKHVFSSTCEGDCGAIAAAHFAWHLQLWDHITQAHLKQWHHSFATLSQPGELRAGGPLQPSTHAELKAILILKGVPEDAAQDRTDQAIAKLGTGPIQKALKDKNCWQALKALASRPLCHARRMGLDICLGRWKTDCHRALCTDPCAHPRTSTHVPLMVEPSTHDTP